MSPAVIIGYYAPDKEVMWWGEEEEPPDGKFNLHDRMRDWVVNGNTFEILEYIPGGWDDGVRGYIGDRAVWWDTQLHNLGYATPMNR